MKYDAEKKREYMAKRREDPALLEKIRKCNRLYMQRKRQDPEYREMERRRQREYKARNRERIRYRQKLMEYARTEAKARGVDRETVLASMGVE